MATIKQLFVYKVFGAIYNHDIKGNIMSLFTIFTLLACTLLLLFIIANPYEDHTVDRKFVIAIILILALLPIRHMNKLMRHYRILQ